MADCGLSCDGKGSVSTLVLYIVVPSILGVFFIFTGTKLFNYWGDQGMAYYKAK